MRTICPLVVIMMATAGAGPTTRSALIKPPTTAPAPATTRPAIAAVPKPPAPPDYAAEATVALAGTLRTADSPDVLAAAADALSTMGAKATGALAALQEDPDPAVRARVLQIASAMNDARAAAPLLARAMRDGEASIRLAAIEQAGSSSLHESCVVIAAAIALNDADPRVQEKSETYLDELGPEGFVAATVLARHLDRRSIRLLAGIGPRAEPAVPALVAYYRNKINPTPARLEAIGALKRILAAAPASAAATPVAAVSAVK